MASHTPGPWKSLEGVDDEPERWIVVQAEHDREYLIATIQNGAPGDCLETEGANALLIAAAPDLLAAAKAAYTALPMTKHNQSINDALSAAIAKAEGQ